MQEGIPPHKLSSGHVQPLPHDALVHIFRMLRSSDLLNASAVCVEWRSAAFTQTGELWRELGRQQFGDQLAAPFIERKPQRVLGMDGTFHPGDWSLQFVQRQFEQVASPAELAEGRTSFLDSSCSVDKCSRDDGLWWMRRFHAFDAALKDDPWGGAAVRVGDLKCAAAEASSIARGRQHVCSSPLQQLVEHARHVIPHRRWASCARCARVVCDDCVNGMHVSGSAMTRCDGCLRLFCEACDYNGLVRFCDKCEKVSMCVFGYCIARVSRY